MSGLAMAGVQGLDADEDTFVRAVSAAPLVQHPALL